MRRSLLCLVVACGHAPPVAPAVHNDRAGSGNWEAMADEGLIDCTPVTLVDPTGTPVPNAIVTAWDEDPASQVRFNHGVSSASSDGNGRACILDEQWSSWLTVEPPMELGGSCVPATPIPTGGARPDRVVVATRPLAMGKLAGRIVDRAGRPVGDASVWARDAVVKIDGSDCELSDTDRRFEVPVRADGSFVLDSVLGETTLEVSSPHYRTVEAHVHAGTSGNTIVLDEGASWRGRVLRPDGTPVPTAKLVACHGGDECTGVTKLGTFAIEHLAAGTYELRLFVDHDPVLGTRHVILSRTTFTAGETRQADLQIAPGLELAGTGKPGECVHAVAKGAARPFGRLAADEVQVRADSTGHFTFHHLHAGTWSVGNCDGSRELDVTAGRTDVAL